MTLTVYHPGISVPPSFDLITNTAENQTTIKKGEQKMTLMQEDVVSLDVESVNMLPFQIGDYITVYEKIYKLNNFPEIKKTGANRFSYNIVFEGLQYDLFNTAFLLGKDTMLDSLMSNASGCVDIIITNLNRVYVGLWAKGTVTATSIKNITFGEINCLEALQKVCEEHNLEFDITTVSGVNYINVRIKEVYYTTPFSIGKTGGLYSLNRKNSNTYPFVTRLWTFGSEENLGNSYRHTRLCLTGKTKDDSYIETSILGQPYGIKEALKIFETKPQRTGVISTIVDYRTFTDSTMDFDLNERWRKRGVLYGSTDDYLVWTTLKAVPDTAENRAIYDSSVYPNHKYLLNQTKPKLHFQTGQLAGYELECLYEHSTKTFTVVQLIDENGYKFPDADNDAFQLTAGDTYIILDISVPNSYILAAETALEAEAEAYFAVTEKPLFQYEIEISPMRIKALRIAGGNVVNLFTVGDYAKITDADFAVDAYYRIIEYTRSITNSNDIKITLSDKRGYNPFQAIFDVVKQDKKAINDNKLKDVNRTIRNSLTSGEVISEVYNTSMMIDSEKVEVVDEASASIDKELFYDSSNVVKVFRTTKSIISDKESETVGEGLQVIIIARMNPQTTKETDLYITKNETTGGIEYSYMESYDTNNYHIYTITVTGVSAGAASLEIQSITYSTITKSIPITVTE